MSELRLATAANVRALQSLAHALDTSHGKWSDSLDREALEDEAGRFRVWSGNLGALQKGHSSLDYRLRDSPLLSSNALRFLQELEDNLNEAYAIVSGTRLPFEQQPESQKGEEEDTADDDGFFSDDDDESGGEEGPPRTELSMRFVEVVDIIDNLYKLSVRIRTPTIRIRSLKAASYKPRDPETGVDVLGAYAGYDLSHIHELLSSLRKPYLSEEQTGEDFLFTRLSAALTLRRRQFKYWKRHRDKLGAATGVEERALPLQTPIDLSDPLLGDATPNTTTDTPAVNVSKEAPSQKTGRTLLSGTEATHHHQSLDEIVDTKSVTSYAITVKDIHGRGVDLPPPPKEATGDKDFECPYCYIICPARYGQGRAWRTHLLQDLQPYCCTYAECDRAEQLFRSRREWVEHEASHRKIWRCPEHPTAVYKSQSGLENHLRREHLDSFPENQLPTIVKVGETTTVDVRKYCPICLAPADTTGLGDFQSHVANHLERIATFALPNGTEGDSDGASGIASRGGSGSTDSHSTIGSTNSIVNIKEGSLGTNDARNPDLVELDQPLNPDLGSGSSRPLLSADSLQQLPDSSQNRLDMIPAQLERIDKPGGNRTSDSQSDDIPLDVDSPDDDQSGERPAELQNHLEQREAFRVHLLSLPGALSVRFYKRYGSWTGRVNFSNGVAAADAISLFDKEQFPRVRLHQSSESPDVLKFVSSNLFDGKKEPPTRKHTNNLQDDPIPRELSPELIPYETEEQKLNKQPVLAAPDIPTLRSLYRSRQLLQRDQSYAPNDSYNQVISFCYYDLTRLKLDAIVNSSNNRLSPTRATNTLNNAIHRAAGPGLWEEMRFKKKLKVGQIELSHGHDLPSSWIMHAARPRYGKNNGMGQFNVLTECYRGALKMASNHEFKTIAFPCLGTGVGFPPRIAARIALQEVREYLDAHTEYSFKKIVFCVNSAVDEKAYMDFFPVFFPPTHGDLDKARLSDFSAHRAALAAQILETRGQVQKVNAELSTDFSLLVPGFDYGILQEFRAIDASFASIRGFLLGPQDINRSLGDLNLICSAMQMICSRIVETIDVAKDTKDAWQNNKKYWDRYNAYMRNTHDTDLGHLLRVCHAFVQHLDGIITRSDSEPDEMAEMRSRLETFGIKQKGEDGEGIRDHLDEALYAREFRQQEGNQGRDTIKLQQIPSLARLYQGGELGTKPKSTRPLTLDQDDALSPIPTLARPSITFNQTVCLVRADITLLEVDIMVNSTDVSFMGMGTLDRIVYSKGGPELRDQLKQFGTCNMGDVKRTPGYMLPAKHILHAIPPEEYRKNTKSLLRGIYREVLHTAVSLRATSVAFPSIGTGSLNYPKRDCAALALEEVKRFLESAEPTNSLEKIIFVVYSSTDELVYKNLLPFYFPPVESVEAGSSTTLPHDISTAVDTRATPRRTLFGSVGEALRGVRSGKQPEISRNINNFEENALFGFESHARTCSTCKDVNALYSQGLSLCATGHNQAQLLLAYMEMMEDQTVHTKPDKNGTSVKLMVPTNRYPRSLTLLQTVEKSVREGSRDTPFLAPNQSYEKIIKDQKQGPRSVVELKAHRVAAWSTAAQKWESIYPGGCNIRIMPEQMEIFREDEPEDRRAPLLSVTITPTMSMGQHETDTQVLLSGVTGVTSTLKPGHNLQFDRILFLSQTPTESQKLLQELQHSKDRSSTVLEDPKTPEAAAAAGPRLGHRPQPSSSSQSIADPSPSPAHPATPTPQDPTTSPTPKEQRASPFSRLQTRLKKLVASTSSMSPSSRTSSSVTPDRAAEPPHSSPTRGASTPHNSEQSTTTVVLPRPNETQPPYSAPTLDMTTLAARILSHLDAISATTITTTITALSSQQQPQTLSAIASALTADTTLVYTALRHLVAAGYLRRSAGPAGEGERWEVISSGGGGGSSIDFTGITTGDDGDARGMSGGVSDGARDKQEEEGEVLPGPSQVQRRSTFLRDFVGDIESGGGDGVGSDGSGSGGYGVRVERFEGGELVGLRRRGRGGEGVGDGHGIGDGDGDGEGALRGALRRLAMVGREEEEVREGKRGGVEEGL